MPVYFLRASLLFVLTFLAGTTFGQGFGIHGGMQKAKIQTDDAENTFGTEVGYTLGLYFNFGLGSNFGISLEAMYGQKFITQQEARSADEPKSDPDVKLKLGTLEIPATLSWSPPVKGRLRPRVYAGPVVSVIVNEHVDLADRSAGEIINEAFVLTRDAFAERDFGWTAGAGLSLGLVDLRITTVQLRADVRYVGGLNSVKKEFAGNPLRRTIGIGAFNAMIGIGF